VKEEDEKPAPKESTEPDTRGRDAPGGKGRPSTRTPGQSAVATKQAWVPSPR
jgi:hypothetical protein